MFAVVLAVEMLLMTAVGIFARRAHITDDGFTAQLTGFVMKLALPCLIFSSMTAVEASWTQLVNCAAALGCSVFVCAVQFGLGQLVYRAMGRGGSARVTRYGMIFTHFSFMGIPVMEALFGAEGLLYYSVFLIPVRALYYGATKPLLQPAQAGERPAAGERLRGILLNPCLLAVVIGLAFYIVFGLLLPDFSWTVLLPAGLAAVADGACQSISWVISKLGSVCTPLGLVICGMTLGKFRLRSLLRWRSLRLPVIRCLALPLLFLLLMKVLRLALPLSPVVSAMAVVYAALPVASLTAAYTIQYDPDGDVRLEASGAVFFSTLLSIVTVPLWYTLLRL